MSDPGDVIRLTKLNMVDNQGYPWFETADGANIRASRQLTDAELVRLERRMLRNPVPVVVVGSCSTGCEAHELFELDNRFEEVLRDYYYERDDWGRYTGKSNNPDQWVRRWADGAQTFDAIKCGPPYFRAPGDNPPAPFLLWKTVYCDRWRMPVVAERQAEWIPSAPYRFCPAEQYEYGFKTTPCCTRTSALFPARLSGELTHSCQSPRNVSLVLHGFLKPKQWHYKFWTHVASASPQADYYTKHFYRGTQRANEKACWQELLSAPIPAASLFSECRQVTGMNFCHNCDHTVFTKVHGGIQTCLEEWTQLAVTVFMQATTNGLRVKQYPGAARWRIAMVSKDMNREVDGFCPCLSLDGVSYNWQEETPTLHLFCQTFHMTKRTDLLWPKKHYNDLFWKNTVSTWSLGNVCQQP